MISTSNYEFTSLDSNFDPASPCPPYPATLSFLSWLINGHLGKVYYGNLDVALILCPKLMNSYPPGLRANGAEMRAEAMNSIEYIIGNFWLGEATHPGLANCWGSLMAGW